MERGSSFFDDSVDQNVGNSRRGAVSFEKDESIRKSYSKEEISRKSENIKFSTRNRDEISDKTFLQKTIRICNILFGSCLSISIVIIIVIFLLGSTGLEEYTNFIHTSNGNVGLSVEMIYNTEISNCRVQYRYFDRDNISSVSEVKIENFPKRDCQELEKNEVLYGEYYLSRSEFYDNGKTVEDKDNKRRIYIPFQLGRSRNEFNNPIISVIEYFLPSCYSIFGKTKENGYFFGNEYDANELLLFHHYEMKFDFWEWIFVSTDFLDSDLHVELGCVVNFGFPSLYSGWIRYNKTQREIISTNFGFRQGYFLYERNLIGNIHPSKWNFTNLLKSLNFPQVGNFGIDEWEENHVREEELISMRFIEFEVLFDSYRFNITCFAPEELFTNIAEVYSTLLGHCVANEREHEKTYWNKGNAFLEKG